MTTFGKDNTRKRHANEFMRTSTGKLAGDGIISDNYNEDSYPDHRYYFVGTPAEIPDTESEKSFKKYGSEVIRYKMSQEELEKLFPEFEAKNEKL